MANKKKTAQEKRNEKQIVSKFENWSPSNNLECALDPPTILIKSGRHPPSGSAMLRRLFNASNKENGGYLKICIGVYIKD